MSSEMPTTVSPRPERLNMGQLPGAGDIARLLGEFVARWSLAEFALLMPLIVVTRTTQEVAAATLASTNSAEGKVRLVRSVVVHSTLPADQKREILDALAKLLSLCPDRNAIAHHQWALGSDGQVYTIDYRKPDDDPARVTLRTAESLISLCNRALNAAHALCKATGSPWVNEEGVRALTL